MSPALVVSQENATCFIIHADSLWCWNNSIKCQLCRAAIHDGVKSQKKNKTWTTNISSGKAFPICRWGKNILCANSFCLISCAFLNVLIFFKKGSSISSFSQSVVGFCSDEYVALMTSDLLLSHNHKDDLPWIIQSSRCPMIPTGVKHILFSAVWHSDEPLQANASGMLNLIIIVINFDDH